ncbi:MAG: tryptophan synthase subunit alpha [Pseudomonadales bacterium]
MSRIKACFSTLSEQGRTALVPYIVAGDPEPGLTVAMMHALVDAGADMIELGVPFSDPMADGPVITLAHERALEHKVSLRQVMAMVADFRQSNSNTPVVLMGYANPIEVMGYATLAQIASEAGVDGFLTVDFPPEESAELKAELQAVGIDAIFLLAPTTTKERMAKIASSASGWLYYVSLKGVTGAGLVNTDEVQEKVDQLKTMTNLPVCIGFGIKDAESARTMAKIGDGIVVGSALVNRMAELSAQGISDRADFCHQAADIIAPIRTAIDNL